MTTNENRDAAAGATDVEPRAPGPASDRAGSSRRAAERGFFLVDDRLFDQHRARGAHPERPERLLAARRAIDTVHAEGLFSTGTGVRDATDDELARAHTPAYIEALEALRGRDAAIDGDTFVAPMSVAAARRAAGGSIALVDALLDHEGAGGQAGVALLRPPGHHATADRGMGFCLLNNAAIAARHATLARGLERVAIIDWDVHHGNGTQDIFWDDPRVLYVSLHQYPLYPGTGAAAEIGGRDGRGFTVNVPLSAGGTDAVYEAAFDEIVIPILDDYAPELVIVSAGFDAHERDRLAAMRLTEASYANMARGLTAVAAKSAGGRIALLLEGGYDLVALEGSLAESIRAMCGAASEKDAPAPKAERASALRPEHRAALDAARHVAGATWRGL
jgi:acetoin utilization deacetylase AcuC-like enzyme